MLQKVKTAGLLWAMVAALSLGVEACGGGGGGSAAPSPPPPAGGSPPPPPAPPPPPPPPPGGLTSWDWILQAGGLPATPPSVAYLGMDGFDTSASYVAAAKARGIRTICYISIGTAENWRSDYGQFTAIPNAVGNPFPGFPGDRYLNIALWQQFLPVMDARLKMCADKGFEYVEFDVMDAYQEGAGTTGFTITQAQTIAYVTELASRTNGYGMQAVQKNADDLTTQLQPIFGAVMFEECVRLNFCAAAAPYVNAGKPAFNAEYPESWPGAFNRANVCAASATARVWTIITVLDLDRPASDRC